MMEKIKKQYTVHYIVKSALNTEKVDAFRTALSEKIQEEGGELISSVCPETPKQLAYPINKEHTGYFCESTFSFDPQKIRGLEENLTNNPQIIRYAMEVKKKVTPAKPIRKRTSRSKPMDPSLRREEPSLGGTLGKTEKREKVNMEDIEKKLDEIIENI